MSQQATDRNLFDDIPLLQEGSEDTLLSASRANELIVRINALMRLRGEGACRVVRSQGNFVITTDGV